MARERNRLIDWCLTSAILSYFTVIKLLPLSVARQIGKWGALFAYYTLPRVRKIGMGNLNLAYGDTISMKEKKAILKESMVNLGLIGVELPHNELLHSDKRDQYCQVLGEELLEEHGTGVIFSGHYGNWEWGFGMFLGAGHDAAGIVRPLRNERLNAYIEKNRKKSGVQIIGKRAAAAEALRVLRKGTHVGILADQSPRRNGVPTTFFGQPCWSTIGPAMIALRAKKPVYPMFITRDEKGFYTLELYPPIPFEPTGPLKNDIITLTQKCQDVVEEHVRKKPGHWMWIHDRWKKQRRLEQEWEDRLKEKL